MHARAGEAQGVRAQNAANSAARPDHRHLRERFQNKMPKKCGKTTDQIKNQKTAVTANAFNIVAEYPQIQHIAEQVHNTAVQKHGSKNTFEILPMNNHIRDGAKVVQKGEVFIPRHKGLIEKYADVDDDK